MFDIGIQTKSIKFYYAGALLALGLFWGCVSASVLVEAPLFMHLLGAAPYFILAVFVIVRKQPGLAFWFAAVPTYAYSIWMYAYAYSFWLHASARHFFLLLGMRPDERKHFDEPSAFAV